MVLSKKIITTARKNLIKIKHIVPETRKMVGLASLGSVLAIAGFLLTAAPVASAACSPPATTYGTDTLSVSAPVATNYDIWVRMQVPSAAASSVMLQVDGGTCYNVGGGSAITPNTWTWVNYQNGTTSQVMQPALSAGTHSLEFIGTNPGVEIDSVLLLANASCVPTGTGTNCTTGQPSPTTPTSVTATATSETSVTVKWTGSSPGGPGLGVGGYYILRGGTKIATVTSSSTTSYTDTTVSGGTNYSYTVEAYDTGSPVSVSPPSSPAATVTTPAAAPATPTAVSAKANSATSVSVSWTGSTDKNGPGLAGYYILRGGTKIGSVNATTTTYTDTTAAANTTYSYTVEAYDTDTPANVSAQSTPAASVTTPNYAAPGVPTGVKAVANSATNVTVTWTASGDQGGPGIGGYNVYRNGTLLGGATSTTYSDTTAVAGTAYSYTVAAFDKATPPDVSAQSTAGTVTTPKTPSPSVPTGVKATANSATSVTVTWTGSTDQGGPGLAGYDIFRNGTQIGSVSSSSTTTPTYTDTKAVSNTAYSYTVAAFDKATPPDVSAQSTAGTVTTPKTPSPSVPTGVKATANSATSVTVTWTGSTDQGGPGLAGYYIIRNGVNIGHVSSSTTTTSTYTDSSVNPSSTYSYTIEAYDTATPPNVSTQSTPAASVTTPAVKDTTPPSAPTGVMATAVSTSQINLTWTASTDNVKVSGYDIYRSTTSNGTFALVGTATTTSLGDTGLNAKTTYYYYVVAFDTATPPNKSANSTTVNATTKSPTTTPPTTATVEGTVTNASTKAALQGATVQTGIHGTAAGAATATTNAAGAYVLSNITTTGTHSYSYTDKGYNGVRFRKAFPAGINTVNEALQPQSKHHRRG